MTRTQPNIKTTEYESAVLMFACCAVVLTPACWTTPGLDLGPAPAGVTVDARIQYYDVNAGSLSEIRRAMVTDGPRGSGGRRWAAVTSWRMQWTYQYVRRGIGCAIERPRVRVTTVITFPRWNPTATPDSALSEWWTQYNAGLAEHERGHAQLAVKAAGVIVREIDGLSGGACDALGIRANDGARRINVDMQRAQAEYDIATRHGATQILQATRLQNPDSLTQPLP